MANPFRLHSRIFRKVFSAALFWAMLFGFPGTATAQDEIIKLDVMHSQDHYQAGRTYPLLLRITIAEGWYIHGDKRRDPFLFATRFIFDENPRIRIESIRFPKAKEKKFAYATNPLELYDGTILVQADLAIPENTPAGEQFVTGKLEYQACTPKSCIPVEELPVKVAVAVAGPSQPVQKLNQELFSQAGKQVESFNFGSLKIGAGAGMVVTLFFLFLGGLALNLTPCIYPLIPITVSYFGGRSRDLGRQAWMHAACYLLGLTFTNSLLGLAASLSGNLLGSMLQNPLTLIFISFFMIFLALSFFGLWEIRLPAWLTNQAAKNYQGYFGTFFTGLTLGVVAAPCLGPFILGLMTFVAQQGDPLLGFLYFFVLSLGLGLPLAILALFSGLLEKLPLSGDWMVWVRKFLGWVLIGMAVYLIGPLVPGAYGESILLALTMTAAGVHLGWLEQSARGFITFKRFKRLAGLFLILAGMVFLLIRTQIGHSSVAWAPYDPQEVARALQEKRPVIVDFTARWCIPCRIMEQRLFRDSDVIRLSRDFRTFQVDLTFPHPEQRQILDRFGVRGVPTILFFNAQGREEKDLRVEELIDKPGFIRRLKKLKEPSS